MGGGTQTLFQPNVNFNDGHFHIVQFIRQEAKSILLVDFQHEITKLTEGNNLTYVYILFNNVIQLKDIIIMFIQYNIF